MTYNNIIKAEKYNNITCKMEEIDIVPVIQTQFVPNICGAVISIDKIKPNPWNEKYYPKINEKENIDVLAYGNDNSGTEKNSMSYRLKKGFIVNHEPIKICPITGIIWSGHNRYSAALLVGAKEVLVTYALEIYSDDIPSNIMLDILHSYNMGKRSEFSLKRQIGKVMATLSVFEDVYNIKYSNKMNKNHKVLFQNYFEKLLYSFNEKKIKYIKDLILIGQQSEDFKNDLFKKIDEGKSSLRVALSTLKESKKSYVYNKDRFNFLKHFEDNKIDIQRKAFSYLKQARHNYFNNMVIYTEDGKPLNIITDSKNGNEKPKRTGVLSDVVMSIFSKIYNELGINANTAGKATNSADIQFPDLTNIAKSKNPEYASEEIEVKAAVICNGNAIFYGGPDMKRHTKDYILAVFNEKHSELLLLLSTINGPEDVSASTNVSGSVKKQYILDLNTILKNHKNNIKYILGSIDNNNIVFKDLIPKQL